MTRGGDEPFKLSCTTHCALEFAVLAVEQRVIRRLREASQRGDKIGVYEDLVEGHAEELQEP